jgi:hypothetical protein
MTREALTSLKAGIGIAALAFAAVDATICGGRSVHL